MSKIQKRSLHCHVASMMPMKIIGKTLNKCNNFGQYDCCEETCAANYCCLLHQYFNIISIFQSYSSVSQDIRLHLTLFFFLKIAN